MSQSYILLSLDFVTELWLWHLYVSSPHCHHSAVMWHLMIYFLSVLLYFDPHLLKERNHIIYHALLLNFKKIKELRIQKLDDLISKDLYL
jgi:hypothetical protein